MKTPELEVRNTTDNQNLEEKADDIIQEGYKAVKETAEEELDVTFDHPHPSVIYLKCEDAAISIHHGNAEPVDFDVDGEPVDREEFIEETSEDVRNRLNKALGIYAQLDDAQNKFVSGDVLQIRYS